MAREDVGSIHPRFHALTRSTAAAISGACGSTRRRESTRAMYSAPMAYEATLEMVANSEPRKARSATRGGNMWR